MSDIKYELGMIGLGVMGRNLVLNFADNGFAVAGFDKDPDKVKALKDEAGERNVFGADSLEKFIGSLKKPRAVMMLVPAGAPVDAVIDELVPILDKGDIIIDGGNSHFVDTNKHHVELKEKGINFLGIGISGGEKGARFGPSMMPGGPKKAYDRVADLFEAASAKVKGENCVTYLGPGSAGHYVKMVHNGIEYGLMQLISETYDILKKGLKLDNDELHKIYKDWNGSELASFLIEITADIFLQPDEETHHRLVDVILDQAKQKGTGKWTSQDAMELQVPLPTVHAAVSQRDMSTFKDEREQAAKVLSGPAESIDANKNEFVDRLKNAFYFSMIVTYAQGMAQLRSASEKYNYNLNLKEVAKIWRGGCIIRAALLEDIYKAFEDVPGLPNLLVDPSILKEIMKRQDDIRYIVNTAVSKGIPVPALSSSVAYFDSYRSGRLPANLIQAQRDYFGSHTYSRIDEKGTYHTKWNQW